MGAPGDADGVKRIGRADQPQQLAGRADSVRALLLSRRSFSTFSCRYGWAKPQSQRHDEWTRTSKYAWRARLSMHISNGWSRQPEVRPVALRIPRRSGVRKTGAPSRFSYIGCVPPTLARLNAGPPAATRSRLTSGPATRDERKHARVSAVNVRTRQPEHYNTPNSEGALGRYIQY